MKFLRVALISLLLAASSLGQDGVKVRGYDRKDGTHVEGYTRSKPKRGDTNLYNSSPQPGRVLSTYGHCMVVDPGFIVCGDHLVGPRETVRPIQPQRDSRGRIKRSKEAVHLFQSEDPCPSTGKPRGRCPGYVVDHINPLACGGLDDPSNMQWQTIADAKAKDKWERKACGK